LKVGTFLESLKNDRYVSAPIKRVYFFEFLYNFLSVDVSTLCITKGLKNLALMDSDKEDKTAHSKSYKVDISPKCAEYIFLKDSCSSFMIK